MNSSLFYKRSVKHWFVPCLLAALIAAVTVLLGWTWINSFLAHQTVANPVLPSTTVSTKEPTEMNKVGQSVKPAPSDSAPAAVPDEQAAPPTGTDAATHLTPYQWVIAGFLGGFCAYPLLQTGGQFVRRTLEKPEAPADRSGTDTPPPCPETETPAQTVVARPALLPPPDKVTAPTDLEVALKLARQWCEGQAPSAALPDQLNIPATHGTRHALQHRAGSISVTGPVRTRNEDACLIMTLNEGATVLVAADGMGGHPDGHMASRLAILGALIGLRDLLHTHCSPPPQSSNLLQAAFTGARRLLGQATDTGQLCAGAGTTLIMTLIEPQNYCTAYLGDGGAFVRRATGELVALMQPQKNASTVLERFLAADAPPEWSPVITTVERQPGDTLMLGSDGVVDRVPPQEILDWVASHVATAGLSMEQALSQLVAHFEQIRDDNGSPIADDNMTLLAIRMPG